MIHQEGVEKVTTALLGMIAAHNGRVLRGTKSPAAFVSNSLERIPGVSGAPGTKGQNCIFWWRAAKETTRGKMMN